MDPREYKITVGRNKMGLIELEIRTIVETMTAEEYCTIMKSVIHYLGKEGYFDNELPSSFAIYNKYGQLLRIEDLV